MTREELKAKHLELETAANAAFARGDKTEGRRLDDAAFDVWRQMHQTPAISHGGPGLHRAAKIMRAFGL